MQLRQSTILFRRAAAATTTLPLGRTPLHAFINPSLYRIQALQQPRAFTTTNHTLSSSSSTQPPMAAETDTSASQIAAELNVTPESLSATLKSKIGATYVDIEDMSGGCGQAFNAIIVSPEFEKKTLLARHRLVNNALKQEIAAIHAWTPKCLTPEQWEKEQGRQ